MPFFFANKRILRVNSIYSVAFKGMYFTRTGANGRTVFWGAIGHVSRRLATAEDFFYEASVHHEPALDRVYHLNGGRLFGSLVS